jgi:predicted dehydrogenase
MSKPLGVGFIGAGFNATFHIKSWLGVRHADVVAVCDIDEKRGQAACDIARGLHVGEPTAYTDVAKMIQDPKVDAVWICIPNNYRIPVMETILEEQKAGRANLKGICCEKPLARTLKEARQMVQLKNELGIPAGYLENDVFGPSVNRGRDIVWGRGVPSAGRPYLARAAEEHSGPHEPWFWQGTKNGGGAMNDMICHSLEATRYLLTEPGEQKDSLKVISVNAGINCLKWTRDKYADILKKNTGGQVDFKKSPVEDYSHATVTYQLPNGETAIAENSASWSFVGPGLKHTYELLGPEYYMCANGMDPDLYVFLSREVTGEAGEDLVEKQNAEQGMMPVINDETAAYGYTAENRHMVDCFLEGKEPYERFEDGAFISELLATAYMAAEEKREMEFPVANIEDFIPAVGQGTWKP